MFSCTHLHTKAKKWTWKEVSSNAATAIVLGLEDLLRTFCFCA
jgi:hypothetical protein